MIDLEQLSKLLVLLKAHKVSSFKDDSLTLTLSPQYDPDSQSASQPTQEIKIDESQLPVDLRTDSITDLDKIMNWSASPAEDDTQLPLTDDFEISGAV